MNLVLIVLISSVSTLLMTGVIWFIQIVHYPLFALVGSGGFPVYEEVHKRLTTIVVGPLMVLELVSSALIPVFSNSTIASLLGWIGLILVITLWLTTWFVQVPLHSQLCESYSTETNRKLVSTNWLRTVVWSIRSALSVVLVFYAFQSI